MRRIRSAVCLAILIPLLASCAATTTLSATQGGALINVKTSEQTSTPRTESFQTTSFGNYEFRAKASDSNDYFYGILPLKFNGGYLALDILFFAPAAFFNLREVHTFYEFDLEKKVVKYRQEAEEPWSVYVPLESEISRAKTFFGSK
jgi:hypothetical protein